MKQKTVILLLALLVLFPNFFNNLGSNTIASITSNKTLNPLITEKGNREVFTFVPGWGYGKIDEIDFKGLSSLAFYDVPVNEDGTLDREAGGYSDFINDISYIIELARPEGTKVLLTLSQTNDNDIVSFLNSESAQNTFMDEIASEIRYTGIDGIAIDFEFNGSSGKKYDDKYTSFIKDLSSKLHKEFADINVAVVLPNQTGKNEFYRPIDLARAADKVFIMAQNFAVPEANDGRPQAPSYGYKEADYWKDVVKNTDYLNAVPFEKIVFERAWYGNGAQYPLNHLEDLSVPTERYNTLKIPLDKNTIDGLVSGVPFDARGAARKNLPLIAKALSDEGILTPNILSYALATIEHETAETFEPIEEYGGRKSAKRLGYEGGTNYFGRGFIQLTHLRNYKEMGRRIGLGDKLVRNPDLALQPEISAKILAAFFKDNGVADKAYEGDFIDARTPINPDSQGWWIASLAYKFGALL
ncbi:MAG: glycosyl hydrolase family 18 protein [bacterium]|nr:glycosyl hydrolase family 18 protein [bacterium]